MTEPPLRAIVVGTGIGGRVHVPALQHAGFEVAAMVGRNLAKTSRRGARLGVPCAFETLTEALQLPSIDVVVIASPPATHAPLALEAIDAGHHVMVEKPFTLDAGEARALQEAADSADVVALVHHEFRFAPDRAAMTGALGLNAIGPPRFATFIWHLPLVAARDAAVPEWWFDRDRGGGWLNASVSHCADAVRLWLGDVAVVNASLPMVSDRDPARFAEDSVIVRFRTASGCEGVIEESAAVWDEEFQVTRIAGRIGNLVMHNGAVTLSTSDRRTEIEVEPPAVEVPNTDDPRHRFTHRELGPAVRQAESFRRLVKGGRMEDEPLRPATFADGVACMCFLDAVRRSASNDGAPVVVE